MKPILAASALCCLAGASLAQDQGYQLDFSLGTWSNLDGGSGIESNGGIDGTDDRLQGDISLSYARDMGSFTGVAALHFGYITEADDSLDTDDATRGVLDLTLRALFDRGDVTYGGFIGYGKQDDYGDSDEDMTYAYIGAEFSRDVAWGSYYGQVGYFTGEDEYDEATQDAPFINLGANYGLANGIELYGALGYAGGKKYGDSDYPNRTVDLRLGARRDFGGFTGYVEAQSIQISYDSSGTRYGDTFNSISVGMTMTFGSDVDHGTGLPEFGRWSAYNANEIE